MTHLPGYVPPDDDEQLTVAIEEAISALHRATDAIATTLVQLANARAAWARLRPQTDAKGTRPHE